MYRWHLVLGYSCCFHLHILGTAQTVLKLTWQFQTLLELLMWVPSWCSNSTLNAVLFSIKRHLLEYNVLRSMSTSLAAVLPLSDDAQNCCSLWHTTAPYSCWALLPLCQPLRLELLASVSALETWASCHGSICSRLCICKSRVSSYTSVHLSSLHCLYLPGISQDSTPNIHTWSRLTMVGMDNMFQTKCNRQ